MGRKTRPFQSILVPLDGSPLAEQIIPLALALAVLLWFVFSRTWWGFKLRAVGAGPRAAEVSGRIDSQRIGASALFLSGAIAGLALPGRRRATERGLDRAIPATEAGGN